MYEARLQAVTGVVPPQLGEARIRERWPSVAAHPGVASLGRLLTRTGIGVLLAWPLLGFFYFMKLAPVFGTRYTLTNRRLMIRRGVSGKPEKEVPLAAIDEVRVVKDGNSDFFRAGNLEILSGGKVVLTLPGVPEPDSFRHNIMSAVVAWVPGKIAGPFVPAKATTS